LPHLLFFIQLHDRVLVKRHGQEQKSPGGIIIPDTAKEKPEQGKVVAVGKGIQNNVGKTVPLDVKEGDTILFGKWGGSEVKLDGKEYLVMKESDILGIIN
jgi:chaperonin GroES